MTTTRQVREAILRMPQGEPFTASELAEAIGCPVRNISRILSRGGIGAEQIGTRTVRYEGPRSHASNKAVILYRRPAE